MIGPPSAGIKLVLVCCHRTLPEGSDIVSALSSALRWAHTLCHGPSTCDNPRGSGVVTKGDPPPSVESIKPVGVGNRAARALVDRPRRGPAE